MKGVEKEVFFRAPAKYGEECRDSLVGSISELLRKVPVGTSDLWINAELNAGLPLNLNLSWDIAPAPSQVMEAKACP